MRGDKETVVLLDEDFRGDLGRIVGDATKDAVRVALTRACQDLLDHIRAELPRIVSAACSVAGSPCPGSPSHAAVHVPLVRRSNTLTIPAEHRTVPASHPEFFVPQVHVESTQDILADGYACLREGMVDAPTVPSPVPGSLRCSWSGLLQGSDEGSVASQEVGDPHLLTPSIARRSRRANQRLSASKSMTQELNFRSNFAAARALAEEAVAVAEKMELEMESESNGPEGATNAEDSGPWHSEKDPSTSVPYKGPRQTVAVALASLVGRTTRHTRLASTRITSVMPAERTPAEVPAVDEDGEGMEGTSSVLVRQIHDRVQRARHRFNALHRGARGLARVVRSQEFDYSVGLLLCANAVTIGIQVDWHARIGNDDNVQEPMGIQVASWFFCVVFTLELLMRMAHYGHKFLYGPGWMWNYFDVVVVGMSVFEQVSQLFLVNLGSGSSLALLRVVRIFRLLRVFRLVRILRVVRELNIMVSATIGSAKSFMWTVVLMLMMFYICGIFITQIVADARQKWNPDDSATSDAEEVVVRLYGTLGDSVLSLFEAMTGGQNWDEMMSPLRLTVSPATPYLFSAYIAFSMLVMMNLVTGIFVDSARDSIREHKDQDLVNRVRELFRLSDQDGSGEITWEEFSTYTKHPLMEEYFRAVELDPSEARGLWLLLDADESGSITADEFVNGCLRLRGPARSTDLATVTYNMRSKFRTLLASVDRIESCLDRIDESLHHEPGPRHGSRHSDNSGPHPKDSVGSRSDHSHWGGSEVQSSQVPNPPESKMHWDEAADLPLQAETSLRRPQ